MKKNIAYPLLAALLVLILPLSFAQQSQNSQRPDREVEALKQRVVEVENKLQTVENVEKMELAAKLTEANAKLLNAEINKFKRELKDANDEWLRTWSTWFLTIIAIVGTGLWFWFKSITNRLIANEVEKNLNGFKEAVAQVNILQDQIKILEREHAAYVLEDSVHLVTFREELYSETTKALPDDGLLELLLDKTRDFDFRYKAAEVLAVRNNPKLVSLVLELLNAVIDSKVNCDDSYDSKRRLRHLVNFLEQFHTQETYEGLTKFLNRLLENPKYKNLFLTWTVFSLARVSIGLDNGGSVSILRQTVTDLKVPNHQGDNLRILAEYFDRFNEPAGIKEILVNHLKNEMPEVETQCLELLQKHDPDFVKEWNAQKAAATTEKAVKQKKA